MDQASSILNRIDKLRALFDHYKIDGYFVPSWDEFFGEYIADSEARLKYISSFAGSNGILIVTKHAINFYTDGRYLLEAQQNLPKEFDIIDIKFFFDSKYNNLNSEEAIAIDPKLVTKKFYEKLSKIANLKLIEKNLIDEIWQDRPQKQYNLVSCYSQEYAGLSVEDKLKQVWKFYDNYDSIFVSLPENICWLLNIRGQDLAYTPIVNCYLLLNKKKNFLFIDQEKIDHETKKYLAELVEIRSINEIQQLDYSLNHLAYDEQFTSIFHYELFNNKTKQISHCYDHIAKLKACKNAIEIKHVIAGNIQDSVALCDFLYDLKISDNIAQYKELDIEEKLKFYRSKQTLYRSPSFAPICGFNEHGAIIHYKATEHSNKSLTGDGLLLIDSGGQYLGATTDVTRTIAIGQPTKEQIKNYTLVLMGHIEVASLVFPKHITGSEIDILARKYLWQEGKDYAHGTGHGIGAYLSVHEGPQRISRLCKEKLLPGMILSNEPGFYKNGEYGIRIENSLIVRELDEVYNYFENLTYVPYEEKLIDYNLLEKKHIEYLQKYKQQIKTKLASKIEENKLDLLFA